MRDFLLFRLYGPMASWGEVAVGETRPSAAHPSKSAILGLVAAALGIKRDKENVLRSLADGYGFGVRVDADGELLRDYHTAQVPPERRKIKYYTRRDELKSDDLYTILSSRDYRTDSCYSIALWQRENSPFDLASIQAALLQPKLPLYLGRKSCPLGLPLRPELLNEETLKQAFDDYVFVDEAFGFPMAGLSTERNYYWEHLDDTHAGMASMMSQTRRDQLHNRQRWQFSERDEFYFRESNKEVRV